MKLDMHEKARWPCVAKDQSALQGNSSKAMFRVDFVVGEQSLRRSDLENHPTLLKDCPRTRSVSLLLVLGRFLLLRSSLEGRKSHVEACSGGAMFASFRFGESPHPA